MKARFSLLALAALSFAACTPTTPPVPEVVPNLTVSGAKDNTISVTAEAKTVNLTVKANVAWSVTCDADWLTVDPQSADNAENKDVTTKVSVAIDTNEAEEARTATLTVKAEGVEDVVITVNQEAKKAVNPVEGFLYVSDLELNPVESPVVALAYTGAEQTLDVYANVSWTATTDADWLVIAPASKEIVDGEDLTTLHVSAGLNDTGADRSAEIVISAEGVDPVSIAVSQEPRPGYSFELEVSDITSSKATVNITASSEDVTYFLSVDTPEYVNGFETGAELAAADLAYFYNRYGEKYSDYGYDSFEGFFLENFCLSGSASNGFKDLDELTTYIVYVFALDEELNVISDVYKKEFTTLQSSATPEYRQWLGRWVITGANMVQNSLTISEKVENESYVVSGLQGFSDEVDAVLNEDGSFSIMTTDLEDFTHPTYGPIDMWFLGCFLNEGESVSINGNYDICTATLTDGNNAGVVGSHIPLSDGSEVDIIGMEFIGKILEGQYAGYVLGFQGDTPSFPATMERYVASSQASVSARRAQAINGLQQARQGSFSKLYPVEYSIKF